MDMDTVMGTTTTVRDSGVRATEVLIVAVEGAAFSPRRLHRASGAAVRAVRVAMLFHRAAAAAAAAASISSMSAAALFAER